MRRATRGSTCAIVWHIDAEAQRRLALDRAEALLTGELGTAETLAEGFASAGMPYQAARTVALLRPDSPHMR